LFVLLLTALALVDILIARRQRSRQQQVKTMANKTSEQEYFSFAVDCPIASVKFVVVKSTMQDARTDAITAIHSMFGPSTRVVGELSRSYGPDPVCDVPHTKCDWAWFGTSN